MDNLAIRVEDVCKVYKLYDKPSDRLKRMLLDWSERTVSKNIMR